MKHLLKYLVMIVVGAVFLNIARDSHHDVGYKDDGCQRTVSFESTSSLLSCADMCGLSAGESSLKSGSKRNDNSHRKKTDPVKSHKPIRSGVGHVVHDRSSIIFLSLTKTGRKLAGLHRLII